MGPRVTRVAGFLPANFQIAVAVLSRLRVRHGTDGQTDDSHQRLMPSPYGGWDIMMYNVYSKRKMHILRVYTTLRVV